MAFALANLSVRPMAAGVSSGSTVEAFFASNDTINTIAGANYFDAAVDLLPVGTPINISYDLDGTPGHTKYVVTANDGSTVTVAAAASQTYNAVVYVSGRLLLTDGTYGVACPGVAGTISGIKTVEIDGGVATNNATCTFKIGTTAITDGVVTIATSGSAAGVVDTATPSALNTITATDAINCTVSNTPGGGKSANVVFKITPS